MGAIRPKKSACRRKRRIRKGDKRAMTSQSPFTTHAKGPYFAPLEAYFGNLDQLAQGMSPLKGIARWQLEALGFMSRRAQAYMEIPSRLQQCRTPQDLVNEQARFWQTSMEQYAEAARRMTEAWTQIGMGNASTPSVRATARDYIIFGTDEPTVKPRANGHDRRAA
jgi:hypothetical protein